MIGYTICEKKGKQRIIKREGKCYDEILLTYICGVWFAVFFPTRQGMRKWRIGRLLCIGCEKILFCHYLGPENFIDIFIIYLRQTSGHPRYPGLAFIALNPPKSLWLISLNYWWGKSLLQRKLKKSRFPGWLLTLISSSNHGPWANSRASSLTNEWCPLDSGLFRDHVRSGLVSPLLDRSTITITAWEYHNHAYKMPNEKQFNKHG